jgi:Xaa-Pro aminopeptidase
MRTAPAATLAARLARLRRRLETAGLDGLVITHPPNIFYLTGLRATAGALLVTPHELVLVVDPRYRASAADTVKALATATNARLHEAPRAIDSALLDVLRACAATRVGVEGAHLPVSRFMRLKAALGSGRSGGRRVRLVPTDGWVERDRAVKDAFELAAIREAARRLNDVARLVPGFLQPGRAERDVAADIDQAMRRAGFERPAFETIVASGPQSALPHARPTDRRLQVGDAVVLDFGGVYDGYCVDLSRTACLGRPSVELARVHAAVLAAQEAAVASIRPGVQASAVDAAAREVLEGAGYAEAILHGTGHGLGLEVHEEPRLGRAQPGLPDPVLEPGMVVTVEPGAYIAGLGGVRIEDDVVVTGEGREILTDAPRALWVIA